MHPVLPRTSRYITLASAVLGLGGMVLLAATINTLDIRFDEATAPIGLSPSGRLQLLPGLAFPAGLEWLSQLLRIGFLLLVPVSLVYFLISAQARKRVLVQTLYLSLMAYAILSLGGALSPQSVDTFEEAAPLAGDSAAAAQGALPPPPAWFVASAGLLLAGVLALAVLLVLRMREPAYRRSEMQAATQAALGSLEEGQPLEDVVQQAYRDYLSALRTQRGVRRSPELTPHEFEHAAIAIGLPPRSVQALTRLFERSRYGAGAMSPGDRVRAHNALTDILTALMRS